MKKNLASDLVKGVILNELEFVGYHNQLPIQKGDYVTILKGTPIKYRGITKLAKKTYKVKVDHTLCGRTDTDYIAGNPTPIHLDNPSVRWSSVGGYWAGVDTNLIPEARTPPPPPPTAFGWMRSNG